LTEYGLSDAENGPSLSYGPDTRRAVNTIDVLSGVSVESTGELHLIATQSVSFEHGVAIQPGGSLEVVITTDPCN
jgi:hypothetical protein